MPPNTQTRHIKISVDTQGNRELKEIADRLGAVTKNTRSLASSFSFLRTVTAGYFSSLGIGRLVELSDEMQNLGNRLAIISGSQEEAARTMGLLNDLAKETKLSLSDAAQVYTRLGASLKVTGIGTEALVDLTKTLINTFRVSGSSSNETTATIIQLSQAFASGTLRGQELRSVLLQNAELAGILRQRFGKNLAKDAEAGLISITEVLKALWENQDRVNKAAAVLSPTIGQTLTTAFNDLQLAIFRINRQFDISGGFAKAVSFATDKLAAFTVVVGILAFTQLPALIIAASKVGTTLYYMAGALLVVNPIGLAFRAIAIGVALTIESFDDLLNKIDKIKIAFLELLLILNKLGAGVGLSLAKVLGSFTSDKFFKGLVDQVETVKRLRDQIKELQTGISNRGKGSTDPVESEAEKIAKQREDFLKRLEELYGSGGNGAKTKDLLAALNKEFLAGAISIAEYNEKIIEFDLSKANKEFAEGKINLTAFNDKLRNSEIQKFNMALQQGAITLNDYNYVISTIKMDELNQKVRSGVITLREYDIELAKISDKFSPSGSLRAGTQSYIESIGTTSNQVAQAVQNAFGALENFLNNFIKSGKLNFREFAQSILDDLQKIIVRASIVQPLAQGLLGAFTGSPSAASSPQAQYGGSGTLLSANGNAFDKGVKMFASGGIVSGATPFGYGKNKLGVMGEAGPEAILPLSRGSGGQLGVTASVTPVNINIINNTGAEVTSRETTGPNGEKTIDLLITARVKEGISSGVYDKTFQQSFGLNRKGS